MRIGYFLLIGLLLAGCSSNQVTVMMRDGAKIESELLSVRDSSIIIQEKGGAPIAIRNEDVSFVYKEPPSAVGQIVGGALLGSIAGSIVGLLIGSTNECSAPECLIPLESMLIGAGVGAGVGAGLGAIFLPNGKRFYLNDNYQHDALIDYSKYYGEEPDELKKIK